MNVFSVIPVKNEQEINDLAGPGKKKFGKNISLNYRRTPGFLYAGTLSVLAGFKTSDL